MSDARTQQVLSWLRTLPFFQEMPQDHLVALLPRLRTRRLADQEELCRTGDPPGCLWLVVRGALQVRSPKGRDVTRIETGDAFGVGTLLSHRPRIFGAVAIGETWLLQLDRTTWDDLIARRDAHSLVLADRLAVLLASQMRHADDILRRLLPSPKPAVAGSSEGEVAQKESPASSRRPSGPAEDPAGRPVRPSVPGSVAPGRRAATRISEQDLDTFLSEMETKVGLDGQTNIRVVHSAE